MAANTLCEACRARFAAELQENMESRFSGSSGTFCRHRGVGEMVLLFHGAIVQTRRTRCRTERIARKRFENYIIELSQRHASKAVRITTVFRDGTTAIRVAPFTAPAEQRPPTNHH
jgi:hypothetical protein